MNKLNQMGFTIEELTILINIAGQYTLPVASKQANDLRLLINKMVSIIDQIKIMESQNVESNIKAGIAKIKKDKNSKKD